MSLRPPLPARAQSADEIIEKHIAAVGGRPALEKITSRRLTGTVTLSIQGNDVSGPYEAYAKPPNKSRVVLKSTRRRSVDPANW